MTKTIMPINVLDMRGTYKGGGGPDKTILLSAHMHNKDRVNILVAYLRDPKDTEFEIDKKAGQLNINYKDIPDKKLFDIKAIKTLHTIIKQHSIQLIHTHDEKTLLYGWCLKILNPHLAIMHTCHLFLTYKRDDFKTLLAYYNYLLRTKVTLFLITRYQKPIIAVSKKTRETLIANGLNPNHIEVLHNCIDTEKWIKKNGVSILRKELNLPTNSYIVGTVARISYQKDLFTFYRVAKEVSKQIPMIRFVIVGDGYGNELELAKEEVKRLQLDHIIHFLGHRNDLLDIYASLDVFLMTSIAEGLPNTILEAMAMEVPIVSTSVDGIPELVVDGECGHLCHIKDVQDLANRVVSLLNNETHRNMFAINGRKRVEEHFSFLTRVRRMEDYYERFILK